MMKFIFFVGIMLLNKKYVCEDEAHPKAIRLKRQVSIPNNNNSPSGGTSSSPSGLPGPLQSLSPLNSLLSGVPGLLLAPLNSILGGSGLSGPSGGLIGPLNSLLSGIPGLSAPSGGLIGPLNSILSGIPGLSGAPLSSPPGGNPGSTTTAPSNPLNGPAALIVPILSSILPMIIRGISGPTTVTVPAPAPPPPSSLSGSPSGNPGSSLLTPTNTADEILRLLKEILNSVKGNGNQFNIIINGEKANPSLGTSSTGSTNPIAGILNGGGSTGGSGNILSSLLGSVIPSLLPLITNLLSGGQARPPTNTPTTTTTPNLGPLGNLLGLLGGGTQNAPPNVNPVVAPPPTPTNNLSNPALANLLTTLFGKRNNKKK